MTYPAPIVTKNEGSFGHWFPSGVGSSFTQETANPQNWDIKPADLLPDFAGATETRLIRIHHASVLIFAYQIENRGCAIMELETPDGSEEWRLLCKGIDGFNGGAAEFNSPVGIIMRPADTLCVVSSNLPYAAGDSWAGGVASHTRAVYATILYKIEAP